MYETYHTMFVVATFFPLANYRVIELLKIDGQRGEEVRSFVDQRPKKVNA